MRKSIVAAIVFLFLLGCSSGGSSSTPAIPETDEQAQETPVIPEEPQVPVEQAEVLPMPPAMVTTTDLLIDRLPVYDWCDMDLHEPIYTIQVEMRTGDVWEITGDAEVTNDLDYNVCVVSSIAVSGKIVGPVNGYNVTPAMHHGIVQRHTYYKATKDGTRTISLQVQFASTRASSVDRMDIEDIVVGSIGYGQLTATRIYER